MSFKKEGQTMNKSVLSIHSISKKCQKCSSDFFGNESHDRIYIDDFNGDIYCYKCYQSFSGSGKKFSVQFIFKPTSFEKYEQFPNQMCYGCEDFIKRASDNFKNMEDFPKNRERKYLIDCYYPSSNKKVFNTSFCVDSFIGFLMGSITLKDKRI